MTKKIKYIILLSILFTIGICTQSFARITTNDPTVNSGETVTVTVNSQEPVASGAIKIKSNGGLTFKSASGGTVNGNLVAFSKTNNVTSGIATYTFIAPEVTETKTFKVVFSSQDMADEEGNPIVSTEATATVTVKAKEITPPPSSGGNTGSSSTGGNTGGGTSNTIKATITKLIVGDKTYKNPSKSKSITVDNSVTSVKISATTSNGESYTVSGSNVSNNTAKLEVGTNKVTIKLASGNVYTLKIQRLPKEEEVKPNVIETPVEKLGLTSLKVGEYVLSPEFLKDVYTYTITDKILVDILEIPVEAIANKEEATIEITGNKELVPGENIIVITVTLGEEVVKYQVTVNKEEPVAQLFELPKEEPQQIISPRWNTTQKTLIAVFTSIIAIMGICYAVIEYRYTKNKDSEEDLTNENMYQEKINTNSTGEKKGKGKHF